MSDPSSPGAPLETPSGPGTTTAAAFSEDDLRQQLRSAMLNLNRREPLDPTYKKLLMSRALTNRNPIIPKDKFYKRIRSSLRERVEIYMQEMQGKSGPADCATGPASV